MTFPTGGTITTSTIGATTYRIHTFLSDGDFVIPAGQSYSVEHLLVGGGGGAEESSATSIFGGGGAGGLLENLGAATIRTAGTYPVVVGPGGTGSAGATPPGGAGQREGFSTTAFGLEAFGGGAPRGTNPNNTFDAGSGAGGTAQTDTDTFLGQDGTAGQGSDGADGQYEASISTAFSGPGGGAGGGFSTSSDGSITINTLGNSLQVNIDGNNRFYGRGGAAGSIPFQSSLLSNATFSGVDNPGEDGTGGGAGADTVGDPKNGGRGIAIFRYPASELPAREVTLSAQEQTNDVASFDINVENNFTISAQEQYGADVGSFEILQTQFTVAVTAAFRGDVEVTGIWRRADVN